MTHIPVHTSVHNIISKIVTLYNGVFSIRISISQLLNTEKIKKMEDILHMVKRLLFE